MSEHLIESLPPREFAAAGRLLARAYQHDPQFTYLLPNEDERARRTPWFFAAVLRFSASVGTVLALEGGVAILLPPGAHAPSFRRMVRSGLITAPARLGMGAVQRLGAFAATSRDVRARAVHGPFWYVGGIGVDPERSGRGIGTTLMEELIARAGTPFCLETASERNVAWYERLGFIIVAEGDVPEGPHLWSMRKG